MRKGEQTRESILARSAHLFNRQGYAGSSLSDILRETGLEKGGIYTHFSSKDQLALEAFDDASRLVQQRVRQALAGKFTAIERLLAIVSVFQSIVEDPPFPVAARFSTQRLRRMMLTRRCETAHEPPWMIGASPLIAW